MPDEAKPHKTRQIIKSGWSKQLAASTVCVIGMLGLGLLDGYASTLRVLGGLVACCLILSLVAGWELKVRTSELARARGESEMFINCVPSILIGTDRQGRITRWNAAAARVFGLAEAEVLNKPLGDCGVKWHGPRHRP